MKKIFLLLCSTLSLIGCATNATYKGNTLKTVKIEHTEVEALPVTADLAISEQRTSGEAEGNVFHRNILEREAIAKALGQTPPSVDKADVLAGTNWYEEVTGNKLKLTVTGYPAYYTNFRTATKDDVALNTEKASHAGPVLPEKKAQPTAPTDNFTSSQRWATWGLNTALPGLGSIAIMDDLGGAITQWALTAGYITMFLIYDDSYYCDSYNYYDCSGDEEFLVAGFITLGLNVGFNIFRSMTYGNSTQNVARNGVGDFNVAVLPNKNGKLNALLMYNKAF